MKEINEKLISLHKKLEAHRPEKKCYRKCLDMPPAHGGPAK